MHNVFYRQASHNDPFLLKGPCVYVGRKLFAGFQESETSTRVASSITEGWSFVALLI